MRFLDLLSSVSQCIAFCLVSYAVVINFWIFSSFSHKLNVQSWPFSTLSPTIFFYCQITPHELIFQLIQYMLLLLSLPVFYKLWNISKEYSLDLPLSIVSWTMYHNQLNNAQHGILIYKNALGSLVYIAVLKIQMTFAWLIRFVLLFWF